MSRNVSSTFRTAAYSQQTAQVLLFLLTVSHTDLDESLYFVNNTENITSRGNEHLAFPFQIDFPGESGEQITTVQITIDNVSREIVETIRTLQTPPTMTLELILASDPDTVEAGPWEFSLSDTNYNELTITGTLGFEDILNASYPGYTFNPADFPGLGGSI